MFVVVVGIIQNRQALNHHPRQECTCCRARLPSENAEPANNVTEEFLCPLWGKFADPMILSASCRSPRLYLSNPQKKSEPCPLTSIPSRPLKLQQPQIRQPCQGKRK